MKQCSPQKIGFFRCPFPAVAQLFRNNRGNFTELNSDRSNLRETVLSAYVFHLINNVKDNTKFMHLFIFLSAERDLYSASEHVGQNGFHLVFALCHAACFRMNAFQMDSIKTAFRGAYTASDASVLI